MSLPVLGVAARTAAGDLSALWDLLAAEGSAFATEPPYDPEGLSNPACARVAGLSRGAPAEALLEEVVAAALAEAELPEDAVVGLVCGTSSGSVCGPWERWHRAVLAGSPASDKGTGRDDPARRVAARLRLAGPVTTLSTVCVSGTAALAVAEGWLRDGLADAVVAAGVDALSLFVHAGFSGLGALSASRPRPFHPDRDGLLLGEGAAALVLGAPGAGPAPAWLAGTALASDATHMTAPDRDARGAITALRAALRAARLGTEAVQAVSVHGTGTRFNDAMEATALERVFGDQPLSVHGVKHAIGHTMGAAGAIEAALVVHALRRGELPPVLRPPEGPGDDPAPRIARRAATAPTHAEVAASLSAAFGGLNAAAVLATRPAATPEPGPEAVAGPTVRVALDGPGDWAAAWPDPPPRAGRLDVYSRIGLLALDRLRRQASIPQGTALVLASRTGCRAVDLAYHERVVTEGAARASRLAFTYTLPGAPLAEASIRFGWCGPQLAFVDTPARADAEARRWIRYHGAPAAIALEVEAPEPDGSARARATLWRPAGGAP